jgi:prevent-host-death family protein
VGFTHRRLVESTSNRRAIPSSLHYVGMENSRRITRDTLVDMAEVSIRDLRNHGGDVVDRAAQGEQITITRSGRPVAELRAISSRGVTAEALLSRWRGSPSVDPLEFREDVDRLLDSSL